MVIIGGSLSTTALALHMDYPLIFRPNRDPYIHVWGQDVAESKLVIRTWDVELMDMSDIPFKITFDIVHEGSGC